MMVSITAAILIQAAPMPPVWSAQCLTELAAQSGSTLRFTDVTVVRAARERADGIWASAHQLTQNLRTMEATSHRAVMAVLDLEAAGEMPEGAALIEARRYDDEIYAFASRYNRLISNLPACGFPTMDTDPDGQEKALAVAMTDAGPARAQNLQDPPN